MPFRSFALKFLLEGGQPLEPPSVAFATRAKKASDAGSAKRLEVERARKRATKPG